ncbi:LysR family transcriptional regulator [Lentilactobacillus sp. Marseille-Q4993]|uniref:LysR substrate-binding domain-containing protein n=1 Tax=Lentilactobacillus sp. Marseille-Q4993 TaxID=3039492 RepID=UPI0024BCA83D|nr:LysR family transcriptional regulator [Lentilactobacillus sp. Marseille-Q4993]
MNSKLLSFLEEIKAQGNMSKAAQSLFVTQPYISRVIKNAEDNFGVKLIDRSSHPIQLTYAGERLLSFLREEDQLRATLDREMTHLSQFKYGHLTIASNEAVSNDIYKPVLVKFYKKYPKVHAQILSVPSRDAEKRLMSGSLDFFVGQPLSNPKIQYMPIAKIPLILVIPNNSKLYQEGKLFVDYADLDMSKLSGESFVSIPHENNYHRLVASYLSSIGVSVEFSIEVPDVGLASELAVNHVGASIIPESYLDASELTDSNNGGINIAKIPTSDLVADFGISFIKAKKTAEPVEDLVNIITEVVKENTPKR